MGFREARPHGLPLVLFFAVVAVASAHELHGDAGPCSREGRGGCKDLGESVQTDVMACMTACEQSWNGCKSWTYMSGSKKCYMCSQAYVENLMVDECQITEKSSSTCTWSITQGTAAERGKVSAECAAEVDVYPLSIMEEALKQANAFCVKPSVTCTGACTCANNIITDGPGDYAASTTCDIKIIGDMYVEFTEFLLGAGDKVTVTLGTNEVHVLEGLKGPLDYTDHIYSPLNPSTGMTIRFQSDAVGQNAGFSATYTWASPNNNLEAAHELFNVLKSKPYSASVDSTTLSRRTELAAGINTYLNKVRGPPANACYEPPSACNYAKILNSLLATYLTYFDGNGERSLKSGAGIDMAISKQVYDELDIFLVDNSWFSAASAKQMEFFFESLPKYFGTYQGIAVLQTDTFMCLENNPVPAGSKILDSMFSRGWPTFDQVFYMPQTNYGERRVQSGIEAGSSPMWTANTRYAGNTSHQPLVASKDYFTVSGDLFLQSLRHQTAHVLSNSEETRTEHMNAMFHSILAKTTSADATLASWIGDYLIAHPEEIVPTNMAAYFMSSSRQMNLVITAGEASTDAPAAYVRLAWMLYSIESMMADPMYHPFIQCADQGDDCACNGKVRFGPPSNLLFAGYQELVKNGTGKVACDPLEFTTKEQVTRDFAGKYGAMKCYCAQMDTLNTTTSIMYQYDDIDGTAHPYFVEVERIGWLKYEANKTWVNKTFNYSHPDKTALNETIKYVETTYKQDFRIKKLTIPGCAPYTFGWGAEFSNSSSPGVFVPINVTGPLACIPDPGCTIDVNSPLGNTAENCVCTAGYTGSNGRCTKCPAGTYKSFPGPASCSSCPAGTYGTVLGGKNSDACTKCGKGKYSIKLGASADDCKLCPSGTFNPIEGAFSPNGCMLCAPGSFRSNNVTTDASTCNKCPKAYYSQQSGATDNSTCLACPAGTFSTAPEGAPLSSLCTPCVEGTYSDANASTTCTKCVVGKASGTRGADSASKCKSCDVGTYADVTGMGACMKCYTGKYSDVTGATECTACGANSTTTIEGAKSDKECKCRIGWDGPDGGTCTECAVGKFKSEIGDSENLNCSACPATTTTLKAGSDSWRKCVCDVGYTGRDGSTCNKCAVGTYKATKGSMHCTSCQADHTTDGDGKTAATDCKCQKGYENVTGTPTDCKACPIGKYNDALAGSCTVCSDPGAEKKTTLAVGSTSADHCVCKVGYTGANCTACEAGKYKLTTGSDYCTPCEPGTYKSTSGSGECTACPDNQVSKMGATEDTDCKSANVDDGRVMPVFSETNLGFSDTEF